MVPPTFDIVMAGGVSWNDLGGDSLALVSFPLGRARQHPIRFKARGTKGALTERYESRGIYLSKRGKFSASLFKRKSKWNHFPGRQIALVYRRMVNW
jgi:hypothetical protein